MLKKTEKVEESTAPDGKPMYVVTVNGNRDSCPRTPTALKATIAKLKKLPKNE